MILGVNNRTSQLARRLIVARFLLAVAPLWLLAGCADSTPYSECHVLVTAEDHYHCGYAAYDHQDYRTAIREFTAAIDLKPDYKYAIHMRGQAYKYNRQYDAAIADFDAEIRLDPTDPSAFTGRGLVRRRQGDDRAALLDYAEAIRMEPSFADAYYNRAIILRDDGDLAGAVSDFGEAVRYYKEAADGPSPRVHAWFSNGGYGDRVPPGAPLRQIDKYLADAYFYRGAIRLQLGQLDHAESDFAMAREIDDSVDARMVGVLD
jgi:tetratricopeptide (TPR) repeat protein